jgi:hypothetical protein
LSAASTAGISSGIRWPTTTPSVHRLGETNVWEEFMANRSRFGFDRAVAAQEGQVLGAKLLERGMGALRGAIGTPSQISDLIRRYEAAGIDQLIFVSQAGRNRHEDICESMELFARDGAARIRGRSRRRLTGRRRSGWHRSQGGGVGAAPTAAESGPALCRPRVAGALAEVIPPPASC